MSYLNIENLVTSFPVRGQGFFSKKIPDVKIINNVSLNIKKGEVLGLVGESGCGKSTLGRSLLRLVPVKSGKILFNNDDLMNKNYSELSKLRPQLQMIFQDPYASLDPRMTIYDTLAEPLLFHNIVPKSELDEEINRLMNLVGLAPRYIKKYPHEFSGGQRQRIAIARALALRPEFIIADEPVSALDVSIQSQIINLLLDLKKKLNLTILFISHDLSVVRFICDRIAVMYLGKIVEIAPSKELFENPIHPYTQALLSAIPLPDPRKEKNRERILLQGEPPSHLNPPSGCAFSPRCHKKKDASCGTRTPSLVQTSDTRWVSDCACCEQR